MNYSCILKNKRSDEENTRDANDQRKRLNIEHLSEKNIIRHIRDGNSVIHRRFLPLAG